MAAVTEGSIDSGKSGQVSALYTNATWLFSLSLFLSFSLSPFPPLAGAHRMEGSYGNLQSEPRATGLDIQFSLLTLRVQKPVIEYKHNCRISCSHFQVGCILISVTSSLQLSAVHGLSLTHSLFPFSLLLSLFTCITFAFAHCSSRAFLLLRFHFNLTFCRSLFFIFNLLTQVSWGEWNIQRDFLLHEFSSNFVNGDHFKLSQSIRHHLALLTLTSTCPQVFFLRCPLVWILMYLYPPVHSVVEMDIWDQFFPKSNRHRHTLSGGHLTVCESQSDKWIGK